jgi:hypothetical protein
MVSGSDCTRIIIFIHTIFNLIHLNLIHCINPVLKLQN